MFFTFFDFIGILKYVYRCIYDLLVYFFSIFHRQDKTIIISCTEYSRLLHSDVKLIKYKEICIDRAKEIKILRTQLAYYKKQAMIRNSEVPRKDEVDDIPNVN